LDANKHFAEGMCEIPDLSIYVCTSEKMFFQKRLLRVSKIVSHRITFQKSGGQLWLQLSVWLDHARALRRGVVISFFHPMQ